MDSPVSCAVAFSALAGAGRSQAEGLLLLCSGGGCLVQASLPEGNKIWETDLMIFPFIFLFQKVVLKSLKVAQGKLLQGDSSCVSESLGVI